MQKLKKLLHFSVFYSAMFFNINHAYSQLSGTYTIDGNLSASKSNYKTFTAAVSDLVSGSRTDGGTANGKGVSGAVIFNVADGIYKEQLNLHNIHNVSATHTITFQSASGDSSKVILTYPAQANTSNNYLVLLDSIQYMTFSQLTFQRTGTDTNANIIVYVDSVWHDQFIRDQFMGTKSTVKGGNRFAISNGAKYKPNFRYNSYINNLFKYGAGGIICGTFSGNSGHSRIINNRFDSIYLNHPAISVFYDDSIIISGNIMNHLFGPANASFSLYSSDCHPCIIQKNVFTEGIEIAFCKGIGGSPSLICNNFISRSLNNFEHACTILECDSLNLLNNNILRFGNAPNSFALFFQYNTNYYGGQIIKNNNFENLAGGSAAWYSQQPYGTDYNNYYCNYKWLISMPTGWHGNLSDFQKKFYCDANSISIDPIFRSRKDLHAQNRDLIGKGTHTKFVKDDIDGLIRDTLHPVIGANEFTALKDDARLTNLMVDGDCVGSITFSATIKNNGSRKLDSLTISDYINDTLSSKKEYYPGIDPDSSKDVVIGTFTSSLTGTALRIYVSNPNGVPDTISNNDSITGYFVGKMKGVYTIGGTGANYPTIDSAIAMMKKAGICGPVTFNIADGTYAERMHIPYVQGISSLNTVTFQSASGDSSKVAIVIPSSSSSSDNYVAWLDSTIYINFKKLSFDRSGQQPNGNVIVFTGISGHINIENCRITGTRYDPTFGSSTGTDGAVILSSQGESDSIRLQNNLISFGNYSIYLKYPTNSNYAHPMNGILINENEIDSARYESLYFNLVNSVTLSGNTFSSRHELQNGWDFYLVSYPVISKNKIYFPDCNSYGFYFDGYGASSYLSSFTNNFFSIGTRGNASIYIKAEGIKFINNNVNAFKSANGSSGPSSALKISTTNLNGSMLSTLISNNLVNLNGTVIELYPSSKSSKIIDSSSYNNYYSKYKYPFNISGNMYQTLTDFQAAGHCDHHSIFSDPVYKSISDLHVSGSGIKHKSVPTLVNDDIDGQVRHPFMPDIGADEFSDNRYEAGVENIISPVKICPGDIYVLKAQIKNYGLKTIDSFTVNYSVNGKLSKKKFAFPFLVSKDTTLELDSELIHTYAPLIVYVSDVEGNQDDNALNDTINIPWFISLKGNYFIGGPKKNYSTFNDAVSDLAARGVCGPVIFYAADSTYNEKIQIPAIPGASVQNNVTFTSWSGDSSKVILADSSTLSDTLHNYTLHLNAASFIHFDRMTLTRSAFKRFYHGIIYLSGNYSNDSFTRCRIIGVRQSCNCTNLQYNIYAESIWDHDNVFRNNLLKYGASGIVLNNRSYKQSENNIIEDNIIDSMVSAGAIGISGYRQDSFYINHNTIRGNCYRAIVNSYSKGASFITRNKMQINGCQGIASVFNTPAGVNHTLIANNMIIINATDASGSAILLQSTSNNDILFNTIKLKSNYLTNLPLNINPVDSNPSVLKNFTGNRILNNISVTEGMVTYDVNFNNNVVSYNMISTSDYNNYFYNNQNIIFGNYNSSKTADLDAWKTKTGFDTHSIFYNPRFPASNSLYTHAIELDGKASSQKNITDDIDYKTRSGNPDIGANEFDPPAIDLSITAVLNPGFGTCGDSLTKISVIVKNEGTTDQSKFTVYADITGASKAALSQVYTGTLKSGKQDTIYFSGTVNTYAGGTYTIKGYTNLNGDEDRSNDTTILNTYFKINSSLPVAIADTICGPGTANPATKVGSNTEVLWYNTSAGGSVLYSGNPYPVYISNNRIFYASALSYVKNLLTTDYTGKVTYPGLMFELTPANDIKIDSFGVNTGATSGINVSVYWKIDSLSGYQTNSSVWTLLGSDQVSGQGSGSITVIHPGSISLNHNQKYSFYIVIKNSYDFNATASVSDYSNADIKITNSTALSGNYSGPNAHTGWNGTVYYRILGCQSGLIAVPASIHHLPSGAGLDAENVSNGYRFTGNYAYPDNVCRGSTIWYDIIPPTGFTDSAYDKTWRVSKVNITAVSGSLDSTSGFIKPDSVSHAKWYYSPGYNAKEGLFEVNISVRNLKTSCDSIISRYFKVSAIPGAGFTFKNVCLGGTVHFTDNSAGTSGGTYLYTFGDNDSSTDQNPVHTYLKPGNYVVKQIVFNQNRCFDTLSRTVSVYPNPVAGFTNAPICINRLVKLTDTSTNNGNSLSYLWDFGNGDSSVLENPVYSYKKQGKYFITLKVTSPYGCSDAASHYLNVYSTPTVSFQARDVCADTSMVFSNTTKDPLLKYVWAFGDGDSSVSGAPAHLYKTTGTYQVSLMGTNVYGCFDTVSHFVQVISKPVPDFSFKTACPGDQSVFSSTLRAGQNVIKYAWNFGDGAWDTIASATHIYNTPGTYKIIFGVENASHCADTISKLIKIPSKPKVAFTYSGQCLSTATRFKDLSSGSPVSWKWDFGNTKTDTLQNPAFLYSDSGNYKVKLAISNNDGCHDSAYRFVKIYPLPDASFTVNIIKNTVMFIPADSGLLSYTWDFDDGKLSYGKSPVHQYNSNGKYLVKLTAMNSEGCEKTWSDTVKINVVNINTMIQSEFGLTVYPNPFGHAFTLKYRIPESSRTRISISDITGREITLYKNENQPTGEYQYEISSDEFNLHPGIYLLKVSVNDNYVTKSIIRLN